MREELLETEAIEMPARGEGDVDEPTARPLPATVDERPSSRPGRARCAPLRSPPPADWSPAPPRWRVARATRGGSSSGRRSARGPRSAR